MTRSPVVELNRAVAVAMADGPAAGLELVDALDRDGALAHYQYLHATRADLLRRLGDRDAADAAYRRARALATTDAERRYLDRRLSGVVRPLTRGVSRRSSRSCPASCPWAASPWSSAWWSSSSSTSSADTDRRAS